jgi:hypothetical protein
MLFTGAYSLLYRWSLIQDRWSNLSKWLISWRGLVPTLLFIVGMAVSVAYAAYGEILMPKVCWGQAAVA